MEMTLITLLILILSKECSSLIQFTQSLSRWASIMPPYSVNSSVNTMDTWVEEWNDEYSPKEYPCKCNERGCMMEVSRFVPSFFRKKIGNDMGCNGPNCYNATLIASCLRNSAWKSF